MSHYADRTTILLLYSRNYSPVDGSMSHWLGSLAVGCSPTIVIMMPAPGSCAFNSVATGDVTDAGSPTTSQSSEQHTGRFVNWSTQDVRRLLVLHRGSEPHVCTVAPYWYWFTQLGGRTRTKAGERRGGRGRVSTHVCTSGSERGAAVCRTSTHGQSAGATGYAHALEWQAALPRGAANLRIVRVPYVIRNDIILGGVAQSAKIVRYRGASRLKLKHALLPNIAGAQRGDQRGRQRPHKRSN